MTISIYNCLFKPKKSAIKDGAVALAISVEAPNKKIAESIVTGKLWEHYPANGDNFFKPESLTRKSGNLTSILLNPTRSMAISG